MQSWNINSPPRRSNFGDCEDCEIQRGLLFVTILAWRIPLHNHENYTEGTTLPDDKSQSAPGNIQ